MQERIVGYLLLVIGLIVIAFSSFSIYQVFTRSSQPIQLFDLKALNIDASSLLGNDTVKLNRNENLKLEIISKEDLDKTFNVIAHVILMTFFVNVGARVASLGISLIHPIKVVSKQNA